MRSSTALLLAAAVTCGSPGATAGAPAKLVAPVRELLDRLGARPTDCPAVAALDAAGVVCASVDADFKALRKALDRFLAGKGREGTALPLGGWREVDGRRTRQVLIGSTLFTVVHDPQLALVLLLPPPSCLSAPAVDPGALFLPRQEPSTPARRIHYVRPVFPEQARVERTGGLAVVQAVITREGQVGENCLIEAWPRDRGFEQAALRAVGQWIFEPATLDGAPIEFAMAVSVTFELH